MNRKKHEFRPSIIRWQNFKKENQNTMSRQYDKYTLGQ